NLTASDIGKKGVIKFGLNYLDLSDPTGIHSTRIASVWAGSIVKYLFKVGAISTFYNLLHLLTCTCQICKLKTL
ncbi:MAG: hypothetical protein J5I47_10200, partial [Vicingus serpentipes]|nr:hypothetical protein [Vicingus serpentipes]